MSSRTKSKEPIPLKSAFDAAVAKLTSDMPLLLHGSGDVPPPDVDPSAALMLATLTAEYIAKLTDAALDAQSMLLDNRYATRLLPPPSFPKVRKPAPPPPVESTTKKRKACDEFWDEPLAEPKIRSRTSVKPPPTPDQWVGAAGVDLFEGRARSAYVRGPEALSTHSFVFSICHDVYAYGRVMEIQTAKQSVEPLLIDSVLMEMVRENALKPKKKAAADKEGTTSDPEEEDDEENAESEEDEKDGPTWPGLDAILPVQRQIEGWLNS